MSDERTVTPMPAAPEKPTGFSAEPGNRRIVLSWIDPENDTIVKWQYAYKTTGSYGDWIDVAGSGARTVRYIVSMLENDTTYTFKIRAINGIGNGAESDEVSATPMAAAPDKPTGLAAMAGDRKVILSWTNPLDASISNWQYAYKATDNYGEWVSIPGSNAATTDHTVSELTNGTTYRFKIRAENDVGQSPESDEVSATPLSVPGKPAGFSVAAGDAQVVLMWNNPQNATIAGWQYSFRTSGDYGGWIDIPGGNAATTGHTVTDLSNGVEHTFRIRAVNDSGHGGESEAIAATPRAVPAKAVGLRAEAGNMQVRLVWTDPGDSSVARWQYKRKTTGDYDAWIDIPGGGARARYTVTGLANDTTYTFMIRAVNGSGAGPDSDEVSAIPRAAPPAKPTGFEVEAGDAAVVLTWDDPDDSSIEGWQYKSRHSDGGYKPEWNNIPGSHAGTVRHIVTGLENGKTYIFKIRAVNSTNGYESDERSAAPQSLRPAAPTGLSAEAGDARVALSWDDPDDTTITGWRYAVKTTDGFGDWMDVPGSGAATTAYLLTGLENGTAHIFKIRAVNDHGDGAESDEVSATPIAVPAKPEGLTATPGDGQVRLAWEDPSDSTITGWQYRSATTGAYSDWIDIDGSDAETTAHAVTELANGTAYRFRLRAVNASGYGAESDEVAAVPFALPAKPRGLMATPGRGWVLLEWDDANDPAIAGWEYRQRLAGEEFAKEWTPVPGSSATTTSYRVTGLEIGSSYAFKVRAVSGEHVGIESDEASVTLPPVPAKPEEVVAIAGEGGVLLEWAVLDDPTVTLWQYGYRTNGGYGEWIDIPGSGAATTGHRVTGLDIGIPAYIPRKGRKQ